TACVATMASTSASRDDPATLLPTHPTTTPARKALTVAAAMVSSRANERDDTILLAGDTSMEAIALGIVIGAGAVLAGEHGKEGQKKAVGYAARQAGFSRGQVDAALKKAHTRVREEYQRGREENPPRYVDVPPPSSNGHTNGTFGPTPPAS